MPRIGLDLRPTEPGFKAHFGRGTGRYTTELIQHMLAFTQDDSYRHLELCPVGSQSLGASGLERLIYRWLPLGRVTVEQQLLLPHRISRLNVDLFHFLAHVDAPALCRSRYIITILDLIPLKFPELYKAHKTNWRYNFARLLERKAIARASGIMAISRATKQDIVDILGIEPDRIIVTPLAVSNSFSPLGGGSLNVEHRRFELRKKFALPVDRQILLYVGGIDARKNIFFLLEVFAELRTLFPADSAPVLVLVGKYDADHNFERLKRVVRELDLARDVILSGFVEDADLPDIYRASDIFVFPSLSEGFGLPVLESMASGLPVVAGRNSSIPEVCGEKALLLPDGDKERWVRSIYELLLAKERQAELSEQGLIRSRQFSWTQTARLTLDAYSYFLELSSKTRARSSCAR